MNARAKIAAGIVAGLIAGTALMGAAFAAPATPTNARSGGYGMMSGAAPGGSGHPSVARMQSFMDGYRSSDGSIDMNRMHADVTSGRVTPPCGRGTVNSDSPAGAGTGYGMMGDRY